jgi:hypothetical protein
MFLQPNYLMFVLPALLLALWAQYRMRAAFGRYSKVRSASNLTGAQAARLLLDSNGLQHVSIERVSGNLSDHYDPRTKTLRLSDSVYATPSVAAVGVAAHETGHALQDRDAYGPLRLRGVMVPAVQFGSMLAPILFMIGLFMQGILGDTLMWVGILFFGAVAVFSLVTLPVEFNASKRAKAELVSNGILSSEEVGGVDKVLDAAALTYVASALQAVMQLLYFVGLGNRRRD